LQDVTQVSEVNSLQILCLLLLQLEKAIRNNMELSPQRKLLVFQTLLHLFKMLVGNGFASQFYICKLLAFFDIQFWQLEPCEPKETGRKIFF